MVMLLQLRLQAQAVQGSTLHIDALVLLIELSTAALAGRKSQEKKRLRTFGLEVGVQLPPCYLNGEVCREVFMLRLGAQQGFCDCGNVTANSTYVAST